MANEVGAGIVPIDPGERAYREGVGRALCAIAQNSESVTRAVVRHRGAAQMKCVLIRHGKTAGNLAGRYIGCRTDEPLCSEGIAQLREGRYPAVERVFASPLRRCRETARLLYPAMEMEIVEDFRECDFGAFEGLSYADLERAGRITRRGWTPAGKRPSPAARARRSSRAAACARLRRASRARAFRPPRSWCMGARSWPFWKSTPGLRERITIFRWEMGRAMRSISPRGAIAN